MKRIQELEEENRQLRHAADSFGRLAERLNKQLIQERRRGGERRETKERRTTPSK